MHSASVLLNRLLARGKFRHVQVLVKLAELGSVQRTADTIGMTQSSVTQTLAYLERLLETELFERHARGVRPTPACTALLPIASNMMLRLGQGAEVVAAHSQHGEGSVRIMASAAAINGLLLRALPSFVDRHPAVQTQVIEGQGDELLLSMSRSEVDLVACRQRAAVPAGWAFHPLLPDRFAVVCVPTHPLASMRRVTMATLARQTWLLAPAGSPVRMRFDELASRFPQPPSVYPVVSRSGELVGSLLQKRELLTFLQASRVGHWIDNGLLCEIDFGEAMPLKPLGIMLPVAGMGSAAAALAGFLLEMFGARG